MNSEKLHRYVLEELKFDPRVDASGVGVSVHDRIVTLTGHVNNYADKVAIADAIARVKGVRGVVMDIEVRRSPEFQLTDEEVAKRAATVLDWNTAIPRGAVKVTVEDGFVTLSGSVDWQYQRAQAEQDLRGLAGVAGLTNQIVIRRATKKEDIKNSIKEAMHRRADVQCSAIRVDVDEEGKVVLKGKVCDWIARNAVEDAAWLVAGVRNVDNQVKVK